MVGEDNENVNVRIGTSYEDEEMNYGEVLVVVVKHLRCLIPQRE